MSKVLISKDKLDTLADTIRNKVGTENNLTLDQMDNAIETIKVSDLYAKFETPLTSLCTKFLNNTGLKSIEIPNTVTTINSNALSNCAYLEESTGGKGITTLGDEAYVNCPNLTKVGCGANLTYIGGNCLNGCSKLTTFSYLDNDDGVCRIPDTTKTIGVNAFRESKITKLYLPNTVLDYFGNYCFYNNTALTSIDIPNAITSLPVCCFAGCTSLAEVNIPDSVTIMNNAVFSGCTKISIVHLGSGIATINENVFYNCPITDVYYNGSAEDWAKISISGTGNSTLTNATIHYTE